MFKGVENSTGDRLIAAEKFQFNRKVQDATMKTIFFVGTSDNILMSSRNIS